SVHRRAGGIAAATRSVHQRVQAGDRVFDQRFSPGARGRVTLCEARAMTGLQVCELLDGDHWNQSSLVLQRDRLLVTLPCTLEVTDVAVETPEGVEDLRLLRPRGARASSQEPIHRLAELRAAAVAGGAQV